MIPLEIPQRQGAEFNPKAMTLVIENNVAAVATDYANEIADRVLDATISLSHNTPPIIREQAEAFKAQLHASAFKIAYAVVRRAVQDDRVRRK